MAHLKGPLFSTSASGRLGRNIYFTETKSGSTLKKLTRSSASPSPEQTTHRALVSSVFSAWNTRDWTALDIAAWDRNMLRNPRTWSFFNAFTSMALASWDGVEPWYSPRITGVDHLAGPALAIYVGAPGITTAPTLHWGYTPSCEQAPSIGFAAPWHGGDWGMNNTLNRAGSRIWWYVAISDDSTATGRTPLTFEDFA